MPPKEPLLTLQRLETVFMSQLGVARVVDQVSLEIGPGESVGLVGESGSGKTMTALSVLRLVPPPGQVVGGAVNFEGENLLGKSLKEMRRIRGNRISMIFQEPMTSLNPCFTIGNQIAEAVRLHQQVSHRAARGVVQEMLRRVRIADPERVARQYPHELSGGMRQRAMIAMALCCCPRLLIADEPTTALDVTIQAQILHVIRELRAASGFSILYITHNLGVIAQICDRVAVMYAGKIVEWCDTATLFSNGQHPYTQGLLRSTPRIDRQPQRLTTIEGFVPSLFNPPSGCRFHPRCPLAQERCRQEEPKLRDIAANHKAACLLV